MQKKAGLGSDLLFVIETCQNCKDHHWNTRHDEAKYLDFFNRVSTAITQRLPNAVVYRNQIPKSYAPYDLYCNLIPNDDENVFIYDQVPRTGSFEVSYKGMLVFSKLQSGYWPNSQLIGERCLMLTQEEHESKDLSKYLAGSSPGKQSSLQNRGGTSNKAGRNFSKSPVRTDNSAMSPTKTGESNQNARIDFQKFQQTPSKTSQKQVRQQTVESIIPAVTALSSDDNTPQSNENEIALKKKQEDDAKRIQEELMRQKAIEDERKAKEAEQAKKAQEEAAQKLKKAQEEEAKRQEEQERIRKEEIKKAEEIKKKEEADKAAEEKRKAEEAAKKVEPPPVHEEKKQEQPSTIEKKKTVVENPKFLDQGQAKQDTVPAVITPKDHAETKATVIQEEPTQIQPAQDIQVNNKLKNPDALIGYPIFPDGTKSLLKKHLSREVWEKLHESKDAHGFNFKQAIFSGCKNTDSGIGVYAGSHDSYKAFSLLFDKIIEDYHGHKKSDIHHSDMDFTKLNTPPFSAEEAKMIKSTRIRVGRNLADYPLGPGLSKDQRKEIETKVVQALSSFTGELQGKYFSLSSLSEAERKQLIDDHFLFKEGDRFLEAVGLNREWPDGRGIFHNNEKTFLVWVNEEDQLRIISMQQGADIGAVFTRLSKACAHIETVAKFSHDQHLGYITSCPTNLGTALRASVHIHLPFLGEQKDAFQAIADKYFVQIRGAHGEHTETNDHIYDISNKRRLGRSEVDLVQDMYNGVKEMIKKERELQPKEQKKEVEQEKPIVTPQKEQTHDDKKEQKHEEKKDQKHEEVKIEQHQVEKKELPHGEQKDKPQEEQKDKPKEEQKEKPKEEQKEKAKEEKKDKPNDGTQEKPQEEKKDKPDQDKKDKPHEEKKDTAHEVQQDKPKEEKKDKPAQENKDKPPEEKKDQIHEEKKEIHKDEKKEIVHEVKKDDQHQDKKEQSHVEKKEEVHPVKTEETKDVQTTPHVENKVNKDENHKDQDHKEVKKEEIPKAEEKKVEQKQETPKTDEMLVGSQLQNFSELIHFPRFPEGTKSLLSKYLTHEIWNKLKDSKDKYHYSFKQAIFSGCKNTDSGIGVYAGSHDSYSVFHELFDKIIESYHGHKKESKHVSDMDYTKLQTPPFSENEAKLIKSTRIRVGRNLDGYPLGPGLTKEQRKEVESKVSEALSTFSGELQGKYYSLTSLSEVERKQLIDDHFLFKEGDRFLEACGLNREWPDGRGIFHNNEKTFLVWVNEEDQLRIISMQQGADLGAVFTRLSKACAHIETVAKFSHDEHLGYITSCPTNLGTALRASVHIHLPKLGKLKEEFQAIADKYHVQIRGIHGEHTETDDHVYDISNKRRLGYSEVSLIQDMYNGVKAMIDKELSL